MPGVKYIAPVFDGSGYAEASRNYVLAIHAKGYPITLAPITFEKTRPDLGEKGEILQSLIKNDIDYDKIIVHSTPDLWHHWTKYENNKYIIGYTVWETSKLHPTWTKACNEVGEVWVPCDWNMELFKESGVTTPMYKVPHAIDLPDLDAIPDFNVESLSKDLFVFYSVFQWQERKNPYGLLSAFTAAFTGVEDVVLVLKTYRHDHAADSEQIKNLILDFRKYMNLSHFPKLYLIVENMSQARLLGLHKYGDCFVLMQRSEGWGLPHFEAAACGNPVVTPGYGGQNEFLKEDNSYLVDYTLCPVGGMPWSPYYTGDQFWCEPDMKQAIETLRHVYNNRKEAKEKGVKARQFIGENFTWDKIGDKIVSRLEDIDKGMGHG